MDGCPTLPRYCGAWDSDFLQVARLSEQERIDVAPRVVTQLQLESLMESKSAAEVDRAESSSPAFECMGAHPHLTSLDRRDRLASACRLDRHRPHLQVQKYRRQFRLWLGNGTHRSLAGFRTRLQQSFWAGHRTHRVGTSALPISNRGRVSGFRNLFQGVGIRAADDE